MQVCKRNSKLALNESITGSRGKEKATARQSKQTAPQMTILEVSSQQATQRVLRCLDSKRCAARSISYRAWIPYQRLRRPQRVLRRLDIRGCAARNLLAYACFTSCCTQAGLRERSVHLNATPNARMHHGPISTRAQQVCTRTSLIKPNSMRHRAPKEMPPNNGCHAAH